MNSALADSLLWKKKKLCVVLIFFSKKLKKKPSSCFVCVPFSISGQIDCSQSVFLLFFEFSIFEQILFKNNKKPKSVFFPTTLAIHTTFQTRWLPFFLQICFEFRNSFKFLKIVHLFFDLNLGVIRLRQQQMVYTLVSCT